VNKQNNQHFKILIKKIKFKKANERLLYRYCTMRNFCCTNTVVFSKPSLRLIKAISSQNMRNIH